MRESRFDQAGDARVLGLGENFGDAVLTLVESVLLEPSDCPPAVRIEVTFLFGEHFVKGPVDQRQRIADRERLTFASSTLA